MVAGLAACAVVVPAVPIVVVYFGGSTGEIDSLSSADQILRDFTLVFSPAATAVLSYATFVVASPGLGLGIRLRYSPAGPVAVIAAAAFFLIALVTLAAKGYFPPGA